MDWNAVASIQAAYLEVLDAHYVGERAAESTGPGIAAASLRSDPVHSRQERLRSFLTDCRLFWDQHQQALELAFDTNDGTRICLWGDSGIHDLLPKMGLYFDVALLPDPFYSYAPLPRDVSFPPDYDIAVLNWLLLVDEVRPALVSRDGYPLLVCFPQRAGLKEQTEDVQRLMSTAGTLAAAGFQRILRLSAPPVPPEEILELLDRTKVRTVNQSGALATIEQVVTPMVSGYGMPSARERGFNSGLLRRVRDRKLRDGDLRLLFTAFGSLFYLAEARQFNCAVFGADDVVTELLERAIQVRADLIVDESRQQGLSEERVVAHSFQRRMPWLTRISVEDCLKLRSDPLFSEIKELFRVERSQLRQARPTDLDEIGARVELNVELALREHELRLNGAIDNLRKRTRNSSLSLSAGVGLGLASLAFPSVATLSVGGFLLGALIGTDSVYGLYRNRRDGLRALHQVTQSPVTVLLRAKKYDLGTAR